MVDYKKHVLHSLNTSQFEHASMLASDAYRATGDRMWSALSDMISDRRITLARKALESW